jgi:UDP-4-amino-4,6-dideoxy-N-acetyl-beta-L-altrosamine transaminase
MIPYARQDITQEDIKAVTDVLRSDFLTQGPCVPSFEKAVASYVDAKFAIAVNSATSALHISCLALGLGPGDWLWTSPITFVASANCGLYCGARVDFVDIDPNTYNLCPKMLEEKLIESERTGTLPKILVAVHFSGQACDMVAIHALSIKYGFRIIEDASHAIGGMHRGVYIGSSLYSDITVFSFHPVKIITTAEGGMAVTNNEQLAKKLVLLRSHGITRDEAQMTHESDGLWYYQQIELGYNYRMSELQAALGLSQLNRMSSFVNRRHELAKRYDELLIDLPLIAPWQQPDNYSAFHLYVIRLRLKEIHKTHRMVFDALRDQGIGVNLHYIPVHTQPYFERLGFKIGDYPQAEKYYAEAISLPMYHALTGSQQDIVLSGLRRALEV